MEKTPELESCLSVFAEVLAQSSNWQDRALPQDSSLHKLFLKDILRFRQQIVNYYTYIHQSIAESEQDMNAILLQQSRENEFVFDSVSTAFEIYQYCLKFSAPLLATLETESSDFATKLRNIFNLTHPPPSNEAPAAVGIISDQAMQLPVSVMAPAASTPRLASRSIVLSYPPTSTGVPSLDLNQNFSGIQLMQAQPHFSALRGANQVFIPQQLQPPPYDMSQQFTVPAQ
jgi:hypothetical protein